MSNSHSYKSGSNITERSEFGEAARTSGFKTALNLAFTIYRLELESTVVEPFQYLVSNNKQILSFINNKLPINGSSRVGLTIHVRLLKLLEGETVIAYFHTKMERLGHELQDDDFNNFFDQLISQMNVYCSVGSGWVVDTLLAVEVKVAAPVKQSGSSFIPTPATLSGLSRSILNVRNKSDYLCFLYCVLAALYPPKKHCDRPSSYMHLLERLDFKIQDFPMCLSKIRFFERRNNVSISLPLRK